MQLSAVPTRGTYGGLFFVTLATLMLQLLLTRIFSVTMWYHFAFLVISMAMFGMAAGAIAVYLLPRVFKNERLPRLLTVTSLIFSLTIVASFLLHIWLARISGMGESFGSISVFLAITFLIISIPFFFSGVCVCLALTRFPTRVGALYGADLAGAACGCVALIFVLESTDGPTAVIVVAALASLGALCFSFAGQERRLRYLSAATLTLLGLASLGHASLVARGESLMQLSWVSEKNTGHVLYEKWNPFSYLKVYGTPQRLSKPFGWGISTTYPIRPTVRQIAVGIDSWASTVITQFGGDFAAVDYLKYDITNMAHYVVPDADVLVVGSGGGRDILSALAFDQKSVTAVEINADLIELLNVRFGDFSGHLDQDPRVEFINDEARAYIARSNEQFDIIQISMIDTWAATASGAFVLSEHAIYTQEAFELFFQRLREGGILSVSRWYSSGTPVEIHRLAGLAAQALRARGVERPRDHIVILRPMRTRVSAQARVSTMLASPTPFDAQTLATLEQVADKLRFQLVLSPTAAIDETFALVTSGRDVNEISRDRPRDISPPTDDRPFFFFTTRLGKLSSGAMRSDDLNVRALLVLGAATGVIFLFTLLCILGPLLLARRRQYSRRDAPYFIYFASIGLGFMFVEMSQVQRLTMFLGHPTYGLSVVLTSLLFASGLGAALSRLLTKNPDDRRPLLFLGLQLVVLALFGLLTPIVTHSFSHATTSLRICLAAGMLIPIGLVMGLGFPFGMSDATRKVADLTPWLWGINGAMSVCASVMGVVVSLNFGIAATFWLGLACYALALGAYYTLRSGRFDPPAPSPGQH